MHGSAWKQLAALDIMFDSEIASEIGICNMLKPVTCQKWTVSAAWQPVRDRSTQTLD
jgi:hypothetical protein